MRAHGEHGHQWPADSEAQPDVAPGGSEIDEASRPDLNRDGLNLRRPDSAKVTIKERKTEPARGSVDVRQELLHRRQARAGIQIEIKGLRPRQRRIDVGKP